MNGVKDKVVLVTGASSGIGEATARVLAARGARVVLGARRTERLDAIVAELKADGHAAVGRKLDVTDLEDVRAFVAFAQQTFGGLDVIVNNAGLMPLSRLDALKVDEWNRMIDVNIRGVLHGIAATLPIFNAQKRGHVINVSSIGGHASYPTAAVYCGTKFAVMAISEGLRLETTDVRVTVVSPGTTTSELAETITDVGAKAYMDDFRKIAIAPEAIGRAVAFAIEQPDDVDVSEIIVRPTKSPY